MTDAEAIRQKRLDALEKARAARSANRAQRMQTNTETPAAAPAVACAPMRAEPRPEREAEHETLQEPALDIEALGRLARSLIGNPAVEEAFRRAIAEYARAWEGTEPLERDKREALYHDMRAIRALKHQLARVAQQGSMARLQTERMRIA